MNLKNISFSPFKLLYKAIVSLMFTIMLLTLACSDDKNYKAEPIPRNNEIIYDGNVGDGFLTYSLYDDKILGHYKINGHRKLFQSFGNHQLPVLKDKHTTIVIANGCENLADKQVLVVENLRLTSAVNTLVTPIVGFINDSGEKQTMELDLFTVNSTVAQNYYIQMPDITGPFVDIGLRLFSTSGFDFGSGQITGPGHYIVFDNVSFQRYADLVPPTYREINENLAAGESILLVLPINKENLDLETTEMSKMFVKLQWDVSQQVSVTMRAKTDEIDFEKQTDPDPYKRNLTLSYPSFTANGINEIYIPLALLGKDPAGLTKKNIEQVLFHIVPQNTGNTTLRFFAQLVKADSTYHFEKLYQLTGGTIDTAEHPHLIISPTPFRNSATDLIDLATYFGENINTLRKKIVIMTKVRIDNHAYDLSIPIQNRHFSLHISNNLAGSKHVGSLDNVIGTEQTFYVSAQQADSRLISINEVMVSSLGNSGEVHYESKLIILSNPFDVEMVINNNFASKNISFQALGATNPISISPPNNPDYLNVIAEADAPFWARVRINGETSGVINFPGNNTVVEIPITSGQFGGTLPVIDTAGIQELRVEILLEEAVTNLKIQHIEHVEFNNNIHKNYVYDGGRNAYSPEDAVFAHPVRSFNGATEMHGDKQIICSRGGIPIDLFTESITDSGAKEFALAGDSEQTTHDMGNGIAKTTYLTNLETTGDTLQPVSYVNSSTGTIWSNAIPLVISSQNLVYPYGNSSPMPGGGYITAKVVQVVGNNWNDLRDIPITSSVDPTVEPGGTAPTLSHSITDGTYENVSLMHTDDIEIPPININPSDNTFWPSTANEIEEANYAYMNRRNNLKEYNGNKFIFVTVDGNNYAYGSGSEVSATIRTGDSKFDFDADANGIIDVSEEAYFNDYFSYNSTLVNKQYRAIDVSSQNLSIALAAGSGITAIDVVVEIPVMKKTDPDDNTKYIYGLGPAFGGSLAYITQIKLKTIDAADLGTANYDYTTGKIIDLNLKVIDIPVSLGIKEITKIRFYARGSNGFFIIDDVKRVDK